MILILLAVLWFTPLSRLVYVLAPLWLVWVVLGNYRVLVTDTDPSRAMLDYDRSHRSLFRNETAQLASDYKAICAKDDYFREQSDAIYSAYSVILAKSRKYLGSALEYMRQYDYVSRPAARHMQELSRNSATLVRRCQELSEACFKINDAASDVDISVIDDLLQALEQMQDD